MKKLSLLTVMCACLAFCACSSYSDDFSSPQAEQAPNLAAERYGLTEISVPAGVDSVDVVNWADNAYIGTAKVENGHIWVGSDGGWTTVKLYDSAKHISGETRAGGFSGNNNGTPGNDGNANSGYSVASTGELGYLGEAVVRKSSDDIVTIQNASTVNSGYDSNEFLSIFPAGTDNRGITAPANVTNFTHDVLYVSDGNAFSVYPIYSNGWYDVTLGMFYYGKDGVKHDIDFWSMLDVNWKTPYSQLASARMTHISQYQVDKTSNAQGYMFTIPEHYVFGFYVNSSNDANSGKYYSYSAENGCGERHAVNIVDASKINYLSFEDQDNGDWDLNDLICYVNPSVPILPNPSAETIREELDKIGAVIVPKSEEKIVHKTTDDFDVEARYEGYHKYVRIAVPMKNGETVEIDLDKFNDYCEGDDTRIVTSEDVEVLYKADGSSEIKSCGNSSVSLSNGNISGKYGKVSACVDPAGAESDPNGKFELKVELYPKSEEGFNKIAECIKNEDWDSMFTLNRTKK